MTHKKKTKKDGQAQRPAWGPEMEGEGNKSADRHYREAAEKHARSGENRRAAKRAAKALDTEEGRELEDARERTKKHEPGGRH